MKLLADWLKRKLFNIKRLPGIGTKSLFGEVSFHTNYTSPIKEWPEKKNYQVGDMLFDVYPDL